MRHTRANRCPICGGADEDPRGKEKRCHGWTTEDGDWVHCTREDLAGSIELGPDECYAHRMHGPCKCGQIHGEAKSGTRVSNDIEATYEYRSETGAPLFRVVRRIPKSFRQERWNGTTWEAGLGDTRRVPYRLDRLVAVDPARTVYVVEGEKDVDTLEKRGEVATCNPMGAGKWKFVAGEAAKALSGRVVVVIADADEIGRAHAKDVAAALQGVAKSVRIVEPPSPHKDVTDYLIAGGDFDALVHEADATDDLAPEVPFDELWTPEPDTQKVIPWLGIVPGPVHLVTGSWYTGKTLLLMTMGLAVASGRDLFDLHGVQRGKWTHFDHEMGRRGAKRYLQRIARGLGLGPEDVRGNVSMRVLPRLNLTTEGAVEHYTKILTGSLIATIDPLRAAAPGQDENKSEFRQWLDMLAVVSDRTGCAVLVLHHGGKPVEGLERRNTGRGTSAIDDAVQTKLVLTAAEKGAPMLVSHEKTRENNGATVDDFYLEMDNSDPEAVRLVHRDMEEMAERIEAMAKAKEGPAVEKAKQAIVAELAKMGGRFEGSRDEIKRLVGGNGRMFDKAWVQVTKVDKRVVREGSKNEPVWKLGGEA